MFARFMTADTQPPKPPKAVASAARTAPTLPNKSFVPEIEFDRRIAYWAMTRTEPPTATVRPAVFEHQVRAALDGDRGLQSSLRQAASLYPLLANKLDGFPALMGDVAATTLAACAGLPQKTDPLPTRVSVGVDRFAHHLTTRLHQVETQDIRVMLDYLGISTVAAAVVAVLRAVSNEQTLANQLHTTARAIRQMEGQITAGTLPEEDVFELKLRRDLFAADLRALTRLVKSTLRGT